MSEITDEQRAAVAWLHVMTQGLSSEAHHARALLAALPDTLTNSQPALPTEPGSKARISSNGLHGVGNAWGPYNCLLLQDGTWVDMEDGATLTNAYEADWEPIPERPEVTRQQIASAIDEVVNKWADTGGALASPLTERIADLVQAARA